MNMNRNKYTLALNKLLREDFQYPLFVTEESYHKLVNLCQELATAYYDNNDSYVEDYLYDEAILALRHFEQLHPTLVRQDSPTQKIFASVNSSFAKVKHDVPLLSLQDVFSYDEVFDFFKKYPEESFILEEKIDGLSIAVAYKNGRFWRALTRGTGLIGEDVTENARFIKNLPQQINTDLSFLELRGEVYLAKEDFFKLNEQIKKEQEIGKKVELFANPRNAASGSLRQKEAIQTSTRGLSIFFFEVLSFESDDTLKDKYSSLSHREWGSKLQEFGLPTVYQSPLLQNFEAIKIEIEKLEARRNNLAYEIDGAVIKINSLSKRMEVGTTNKHPRWAVAYKYPPQQKSTRLLDIVWQVGRTGKVTPLALLEPTLLAGSVVSKATLHNPNYIEQKDIKQGDYVFLKKAGDVIPAVDRVDLSKRLEVVSTSCNKFAIPNICPSCQTTLEKEENEALLYCVNKKCAAKISRYFEYVFSKNALDLKGIGPALIDILIKEELVTDLASFFLLKDKKETLLSLHGFSFKKVNSLLDSLEEAKKREWALWLCALGTPGIARQTAKILSKKYVFWEDLQKATLEELKEIEGIGDILAQGIRDYFSDVENITLIKNLANLGVLAFIPPSENTVLNKSEIINLIESDEEVILGKWKLAKKDNLILKFKDKNIVATGKFTDFSRDELGVFLEKLGAKFLNSVSRKTDVLIVGADAGSKLTKAQNLGVSVIFEEEFLQLLNK